MTAAGIDAEIVIPTFKPTKAFAAASAAPMTTPRMTARNENSRMAGPFQSTAPTIKGRVAG